MHDSQPSSDLQDFLDAIPDMLLYCRLDEERGEAIIERVNRTAEIVLGLSAEELIGLPPRKVLTPDQQPTEEFRRTLFAELKRRGMLEYPTVLRIGEGGAARRIRVRIVMGDAIPKYVLFQAEVLGEVET